jgi:kinetochore-associated protein 1
MSELEQLQGQLNVTVQDFENQNKAMIVESLWRDHSQNPRALMLMCQICIYYKIHNPRVWANMLCHMEQLNMVNHTFIRNTKLSAIS